MSVEFRVRDDGEVELLVNGERQENVEFDWYSEVGVPVAPGSSIYFDIRHPPGTNVEDTLVRLGFHVHRQWRLP